MARLQKIQDALLRMNGAVFQQLIDSYFILSHNGYRAFSRTGSMVGKQKTTQGTPDTFILLPGGNYLFIESTTDTSTKNKLEKDIHACFDKKKSKIPIEKIQEIALCFNWNIDQGRVEVLQKIAQSYKKDVNLTFVMLDQLALEISNRYPFLANQYLDLPLCTGQIVPRSHFISEYNKASQGIATPLDNEFLFREQELIKFQQTLVTNNLIILSGKPGVGKTQLGLEGISRFLRTETSYTDFYISNKHAGLLEDLQQYLDKDNDYVLFVDDAIRLKQLNQILGFFKGDRNGSLKIILTVRGYALDHVKKLCSGFDPSEIEIGKLEAHEIANILKAEPYGIKDADQLHTILRIANGNIRLAIMAATYYTKTDDTFLFENEADLYRKYFATFITDNGELNKPINKKVLGLIAFFYSIKFDDSENILDLLTDFDIGYEEFKNAVEVLSNLELVEKWNGIVKISEQNFATFFFCSVFVEGDFLSFKTLLFKYIDKFSDRFKYTIEAVIDMFGSEQVKEKIRPILIDYWNEIKGDDDKAFKFLSIFSFYMHSEILLYCYQKIKTLPEVDGNINYQDYIENDPLNFDQNVLSELLSKLFSDPKNYRDVLSLGFDYVKKKPEHLARWISHVQSTFTLSNRHNWNQLESQNILFDLIIKGIENEDSFFATVFYEVAFEYLTIEIRILREIGKDLDRCDNLELPAYDPIKQLRSKIWKTVTEYFENYSEESFAFMDKYSELSIKNETALVKLDVEYLIPILDKFYDPKLFKHCLYVHRQIEILRGHSIVHPLYSKLIAKFNSTAYQIFSVIRMDLAYGEPFEWKDYEEFQQRKFNELDSNFIFSNQQGIVNFISDFLKVKKYEEQRWDLNLSLERILFNNLKADIGVGCMLISRLRIHENEIRFVPKYVLKDRLSNIKDVDQIWKVVADETLDNSGTWKLSFFNHLDEKILEKKHFDSLMATFDKFTGHETILFNKLEKFRSFDSDIIINMANVIAKKNRDESLMLKICYCCFDKYFDQLKKDLPLLKETYLQQIAFQSILDLEHKKLKSILALDPMFLFDFIKSFERDNEYNRYDDIHFNLSFVWGIDNIEPVMHKLCNHIVENYSHFGMSEHFCNRFFRMVPQEFKKKAETFILAYLETNIQNVDRVNMIVDVTRHSMWKLFERLVLLFLELSQDPDHFAAIYWRGKGSFSFGKDIILAEKERKQWERIQAIVNKSKVGSDLIPITGYITEKIDECNVSAKFERNRKFAGFM